MSNNVLELASHAVVSGLTKLTNRCLKAECSPPVLEVAKMIPTYKEGGRKEFENFGPISLLPSVAGVFERLLYENMMRTDGNMN